jgi:hypothetical protein
MAESIEPGFYDNVKALNVRPSDSFIVEEGSKQLVGQSAPAT